MYVQNLMMYVVSIYTGIAHSYLSGERESVVVGHHTGKISWLYQGIKLLGCAQDFLIFSWDSCGFCAFMVLHSMLLTQLLQFSRSRGWSSLLVTADVAMRPSWTCVVARWNTVCAQHIHVFSISCTQDPTRTAWRRPTHWRHSIQTSKCLFITYRAL